MANIVIRTFVYGVNDIGYEVTTDGDLFDEYKSYRDSSGNKVTFTLTDVLQDLLVCYGHTVKIV